MTDKTMSYIKLTMTDEELRQLLDLRRSNAARPHKNKKKYSRKKKHRGKVESA